PQPHQANTPSATNNPEPRYQQAGQALPETRRRHPTPIVAAHFGGTIAWVSDGFSGSAHDIEAARQTGILQTPNTTWVGGCMCRRACPTVVDQDRTPSS
ncbi:MAG: transposase family protein, partial [Bifidobacteriaceae bacterium]|nr:transposase family protein [Bifidobacteriaceae bacterium]